MPSKIYTGLNILNFVGAHDFPPEGAALTLNSPRLGTLSISGSMNVAPATALGAYSVFIYRQSGNLDFDDIPDTALITRVTQRVTYSYNISADADNNLAESQNSISISSSIYCPFVPANILLTISHSEQALGPIGFLQADSDTNIIDDDYSVSPITKAQLLIDYADRTLVIIGVGTATSDGGTGNGPFTIAFSYNITNWLFTVYYDDEPIQFELVDDGDSLEVSNESTIKSLTGEDAEDITDVLVEVGTDEEGETIYTPATIKERTPGKVIFIVPNPKYPPEGIPPGTILPVDPIKVAIRGKTFDGIVIIGSFTILYSQSSGIYELSPSKTNDTLYLHNTGETADYSIPEPFIKTGFIDG